MSKPKKSTLNSATTRRVVEGNTTAAGLMLLIIWSLRQVSPLPWSPELDTEVALTLSLILGSLASRILAKGGIG